MHPTTSRQAHHDAAGDHPVYSVIVPAWNEEPFLPATLAAITAAMAACPLPGELVVVDNHSTDRTAALATAAGARVVHEPINGIARARNAGAAAAHGRFLVFVDADTHPSPALLRAALSALVGGACCGGGTLIRFDQPLALPARLAVRLWSWLSVRLRWAAGCFIFCRRDGFLQTGGFDPQVYISEEIGFSRRLGRWGRRRGLRFLILRRHPVLSSARKMAHATLRYVLLTHLAILLFPIGIRSRRLCAFWYERPWSTTKPPVHQD